jgi:hypothetical protein
MGIGLRFVPSLNPSLLVIDKIGIMVALMGGILLIAGLIINRNPGIMGDIAAFSAVLELFLLGMSGIIFLIAKFIPYRSAMKALLILGALSLITAAFTVVMAGMGYVIKEYELDNILTGLGVVALIIAGIAFIAAGLQLAAPYITIGLAVLGGIVLIALGISQALYNIAEALKIMEEVEDFDASNCVAALESVLGLVPVLSKFDDDFVDAVEIASDCIKPMAKMISENVLTGRRAWRSD